MAQSAYSVDRPNIHLQQNRKVQIAQNVHTRALPSSVSFILSEFQRVLQHSLRDKIFAEFCTNLLLPSAVTNSSILINSANLLSLDLQRRWCEVLEQEVINSKTLLQEGMKGPCNHPVYIATQSEKKMHHIVKYSSMKYLVNLARIYKSQKNRGKMWWAMLLLFQVISRLNDSWCGDQNTFNLLKAWCMVT